MGFKSEQRNSAFSHFEKFFKDKKNRTKETMKNMEEALAWDRIEAILMKDYPGWQKKRGNKAYNPLFLFKCLLSHKAPAINCLCG